MVRSAALAGVLALSGCLTFQPSVDSRVRLLHSPDPAVRDLQFKELSRAPEEVMPSFRQHLGEGYSFGFPIAALMVQLGRGEAVPLEIKVIHFARFDWPAALTTEKAVGEPYVWNEIEGDLLRVGRPALRLLADALAHESPDEARAMRVVRLMLRLGGSAPDVAVAEFERLLGVERKLGGVRVGDVAGAAILHLMYQDVALGRADDLAAEARRALETLRGTDEETWIRKGAEAAGDAAEWRDYLPMMKDLLAPDIPAGDPARALGEHPWGADRLLERRTGVRLRRSPALARLDVLKEVRRRPAPDPSLALKWERWMESKMVRLAVAKAGFDGKTGRGALLWLSEQRFHCTEDGTESQSGVRDGRPRLLFVQALDLGTQAGVGEYTWDEKEILGGAWRFDVDNGTPAILFTPGLKDCTIVVIEDAPDPLAPAPMEEAARDLAGRCLKLLDRPGHVVPAARALAYLGAGSAAPALAKRAATLDTPAERSVVAGALIILGDPAGLDILERGNLPHVLAKHELEAALGAAKDERLRSWLKAQAARP